MTFTKGGGGVQGFIVILFRETEDTHKQITTLYVILELTTKWLIQTFCFKMEVITGSIKGSQKNNVIVGANSQKFRNYKRLKRSNMKVAILVLVLVALTASVAYAAPVEETELEAILQKMNLRTFLRTFFFGGSQPTAADDSADETLLEKLMQQETASEQDKTKSILAQVKEEQINAALQEFFAEEQVSAELQGWVNRAINYINRTGTRLFPGR